MSHRVYVIRLSDEVLQRRSFREANPDYRPGKPCVYVGLTGLAPEERFRHHQRGYEASRFVRRYGRYLVRRQYEPYDPMPYREAAGMERRLPERLRRKRYAVWQNEVLSLTPARCIFHRA